MEIEVPVTEAIEKERERSEVVERERKRNGVLGETESTKVVC